MLRSRKSSGLLAAVTVASVALAGCTTKGSQDGGSGEGAVTTGVGISGTTINLGVVSDYTGPFSPLATDALRGIEQYWEANNADGGVCGTYDVELVVRDHQFNVQQAVVVYQELAQDVLAFQDFSGAAQIAAVLPDLEADSRLVMANSATQQLVDSPMVMIPAAHIGTDAQLTLQWLLQNDTIAAGDTVAVVYQETDFGEQAKEGVEEAAAANDLTVQPYQVKPTDTDMTAAVSDALRQGADAIVAAVAPAQTASIATVLQSEGATTPIAGVYSSFSPALLQSPAADYLTSHYTLTSYVATFETGAGAELYDILSSARPGETITANAALGYNEAVLMDALLEAACEVGDLTPEGLAAQRAELGPIDFDGYKVPFDYTEVGESPTDEAFVVQPDASVPGGLRTVSDGPFSLGS
ncbi:ABC transporter substrate-binding protein [Blastococcus sp. SYSU D00820]